MRLSLGMLAALSLSGAALLGSDGAAASHTIRYTYDAKGRLIKVEGDGTSASTSIYAYDAADNRSNVRVTASPRVLNESFENPSLESYAYSPAAPDLTFAGGAGISRSGDAWGFPTPWNGNQLAFLQSNGNSNGYVDMKAINLSPGRRYQIAFAAVQRPGYPTNSVKVYIEGALVLDQVPGSSTAFQAYATPAFTASQSAVTIRFSSTPTSYDSASGIDAVSVQLIG